MAAHWYRAPIVLVENDPNDVFFVRHALETARISNPLTVCTNAEQVRRELAESDTAPALFILDIGLDGAESGLDFFHWLRNQPAPLGLTPTMMLTGSASPEDRPMAQQLGAVTFLEKPASAARLTEAVRALGLAVVTSAISGEMGFRLIGRS